MAQVSDDVDSYFGTRLAHDAKRGILWGTLCQHAFQTFVPEGGSVLELGAGWCDFINNIRAERRVAVDIWPGTEEQAAPGVDALIRPATDLSVLSDGSFDVVFASNFLEHLHHHEVSQVLEEVRRVLRPGGALLLVQPNFRLSPGRYFDDYTHVSIWSDVGLTGFLTAHGFQVDRVQPRFLPLTVKSRFPVRAWLVRAYLWSPLKPLAGQMFLVVRRPVD